MPTLHDDREEFIERARAANEATLRRGIEDIVFSLIATDKRRTAKNIADAIISGDLPGTTFRA